MILKPMNDNIIVKLPEIKKENTTSSGILLVEKNKLPEKPDMAEVVAVGEGRITSTGTIIPSKIKVGDNVIFNKFAGTEINISSGRYLIIKETDILVVVSE